MFKAEIMFHWSNKNGRRIVAHGFMNLPFLPVPGLKIQLASEEPAAEIEESVWDHQNGMFGLYSSVDLEWANWMMDDLAETFFSAGYDVIVFKDNGMSFQSVVREFKHNRGTP